MDDLNIYTKEELIDLFSCLDRAIIEWSNNSINAYTYINSDLLEVKAQETRNIIKFLCWIKDTVDSDAKTKKINDIYNEHIKNPEKLYGLDVPYEDIPLLINKPSFLTKTVVEWRLKIGK